MTSDRRLVLFAVLVIALSLLFVRANYSAAFPQASIDLKYSRDEITRRAEAFLLARGLHPDRFRNLTLFDDDSDARLYLERELGLPEANRLMADGAPVWRWRARWFQPPDKEELVVYLSPAARLLGFEHTVREEDSGARLSKDAARALAEVFLREQTRTPQRLVEERLQERPNRFDYVFTWEQEDFRAKDATCRRTLVVQGGEIGSYREYLHVPEEWQRGFQALRSKNSLYATIAESLYLPLGLAALAAVFLALRRGNLAWKPLVLIAGAVGAFMILNEINGLPFFVDRMPTSSPLPQSVLIGILQALGAGVGVFFYVILAAGAGEPLYRADFPRRLALRAAFTWQGIRTREFFRATVCGYAFAAFHIAFVCAFYVYGQRFGVWSPQDVAYSDLLSTALPWIYPLTISLLAASSEEFWFRLFAIPLLRRALPTWLAVVIPAFVWGFLHANYPQQPGYIRGIEVGVIGVAAGFLMLRFGILATLIWHYTVDAVLIGSFLFQSQSLYFKASGALVAGVVMLPLLVSLAAYRRHGGFASDPALLNAAAPAPPLEAPSTPEPRLEPLAPSWNPRWLWLAAAIAVALGFAFHARPFGDFIRVRLSREHAAEIAARQLRNRGQDPAAWRSVTAFSANLNAAEFEYLRQHNGAAAANHAVESWKATAVWHTRYFQPERKEEWRVYVDQRGDAYRVDHLLDEKAPGANPSREEALAIALAFLKNRPAIPIDRLRLADEHEEKRERRTDYTFVWEDPAFHIGAAKARLTLDVIGGEISGYRQFIQLPEEWLRDYEKPRLQRMLLPGLLGAFALPLLVLFLRRLGSREHHFDWRAYGLAAVAGMALAAASDWNALPQFGGGYDTAGPWNDYVVRSLLMAAAGILLAGLAAVLSVLALDVFRQRRGRESARAQVEPAARRIGGRGARRRSLCHRWIGSAGRRPASFAVALAFAWRGFTCSRVLDGPRSSAHGLGAGLRYGCCGLRGGPTIARQKIMVHGGLCDPGRQHQPVAHRTTGHVLFLCRLGRAGNGCVDVQDVRLGPA